MTRYELTPGGLVKLSTEGRDGHGDRPAARGPAPSTRILASARARPGPPLTPRQAFGEASGGRRAGRHQGPPRPGAPCRARYPGRSSWSGTTWSGGPRSVLRRPAAVGHRDTTTGSSSSAWTGTPLAWRRRPCWTWACTVPPDMDGGGYRAWVAEGPAGRRPRARPTVTLAPGAAPALAPWLTPSRPCPFESSWEEAVPGPGRSGLAATSSSRGPCARVEPPLPGETRPCPPASGALTAGARLGIVAAGRRGSTARDVLDLAGDVAQQRAVGGRCPTRGLEVPDQDCGKPSELSSM